MQRIELNSKQDTIDLAAKIAPLLKPGDIVCLYGDLGSGKTFFTKYIAKYLGILEEVDSPSFVLLKEYRSGRYPLLHLDLYRLKHEEELLELGIYDMLHSAITIIEWPQLAENILPCCSYRLQFFFDGIMRYVDLESMGLAH